MNNRETQSHISMYSFSPEQLFVVFLRMCLLTGLRWYLVDVSIFLSPIISDVEASFQGFFFSFFKEIVCIKLTSSQWLLEGLPCPDRFLITYGRTLLEVGCPLQPHRLCEYEVTLGADFQVVITEGVHKAAALLVPRAVSSGNRSLGTVAILVWRLEWETPGRLCRYFFPPPCTCQTNPKFCWDSDAEGAVLPRWGHFSKLVQLGGSADR